MRVLSASVLALCACAGASPARQAQLDAAFARIQVAEARIAHARADVGRVDVTKANGCSEVLTAAGDALRASERVCEIAREIADADALARCEQGERDYHSVLEQARRRCPDHTPALVESRLYLGPQLAEGR